MSIMLIINDISGEQINYYFICKTKLWLFSHNIEMEHGSDLVSFGKILDKTTFKKEKRDFIIDNKIQIDFIKKGEVIELHEIKKSRTMENAHKFQLLYYMYYLKKNKGMDNTIGFINYPTIRKKVMVELSKENEIHLEEILEDIVKIVNSTIPKPKKSRICINCAYFEFCFS